MAKFKVNTSATYTLTGKPEAFRAIHNKASYARVVKAAVKGKISGEKLLAVLALTPEAAAKLATETEWKVAAAKSVSGFRTNHADFVGYLVRGGYLKAAA